MVEANHWFLTLDPLLELPGHGTREGANLVVQENGEDNPLIALPEPSLLTSPFSKAEAEEITPPLMPTEARSWPDDDDDGVDIGGVGVGGFRSSRLTFKLKLARSPTYNNTITSKYHRRVHLKGIHICEFVKWNTIYYTVVITRTLGYSQAQFLMI